MPYLLVRHKVADYDKWKVGFDADPVNREDSQMHLVKLLRGIDDPRELILLFEVTDLEWSREFMRSDDLKRRMEMHGVTDRPDVYFLEKAPGT